MFGPVTLGRRETKSRRRATLRDVRPVERTKAVKERAPDLFEKIEAGSLLPILLHAV